MVEDRLLALEGVRNFRDYGDYPLVGGGRIRPRVLWRSGQHVAASEADLLAIARLGIVTITDLRGDSERKLNPCRRHEGFAAEVLTCDGETAALASHIDAAQSVVAEGDARRSMCRLYAGLPYRANLVSVLRRYLAALGEREGASLIHCFAGKDRTGFAVAMTHHALGVHPDDAMQDYLLTNAAVKGRGFPGKSGGSEARYAALSASAREALFGVREEYLHAAYAAIRDSHGSLDTYLADVLGIDDAHRERLRARLADD